MLHHVYRSLSAALNAAVAEQLLVRNPCQGITAPRRAEFEAKTLTVEQSQRLLAVARDHPIGPLLTVALSTGMRAGELLALTWADVDFERGLITVNKSVKWLPHGKHQVGSTKTRSSRRTIAVGGPAIRALIHQHHHCLKMELHATRWESHDLVFPSIHGTFTVPQGKFVRDFRSLLAKAGCPQIRFHDLRHTAGLFLTRSVGVVVASRVLGHSTPTITTTFYGHAQPEDFTAAARAMGELLDAGGGS
jgi:integrase